jgi:hypothetical protein
MDLLS